MLYLLDANVLIRAHEDYYGLEQVPQFWQWLSGMAEAGQIKMPLEIHDEIAVANGPLPNWICNATTKKALILDEEVDQDLFDQVLSCYSANLSDSDLEKIGRDPFLIAYALSAPDRIVVTKESLQGKARTVTSPMFVMISALNGCQTLSVSARLDLRRVSNGRAPSTGRVGG